MHRKLLLLTAILAYALASFAQIGEYKPFWFLPNIDKQTITTYKIKSIEITTYRGWGNRPPYTDKKEVYTYTAEGQLLCHESYTYFPNNAAMVDQLVIDCYKYEEEVQVRRTQYRDHKDTVALDIAYRYDRDDRGNIIRIITEDLKRPNEPKHKFKFYNHQNKVAKYWTSYGAIREFIYDENGNLIEEKSEYDGRKVIEVAYQYDRNGKLIRSHSYRIRLCGNAPRFTNDRNKLKVKKTVSMYHTRNENQNTYENFYPSDSIVELAYYDRHNEWQSLMQKTYKAGLIQSVVEKYSTKHHAKTLYQYQFY